VNVGAVPAHLEERKAERVLAGQKCAADKSIAITHGPIAAAAALDIELVGRANALGGETRHLR
jgi:hypothetical protein